jgi:hypothetical protein
MHAILIGRCIRLINYFVIPPQVLCRSPGKIQLQPMTRSSARYSPRMTRAAMEEVESHPEALYEWRYLKDGKIPRPREKFRSSGYASTDKNWVLIMDGMA